MAKNPSEQQTEGPHYIPGLITSEPDGWQILILSDDLIVIGMPPMVQDWHSFGAKEIKAALPKANFLILRGPITFEALDGLPELKQLIAAMIKAEIERSISIVIEQYESLGGGSDATTR